MCPFRCHSFGYITGAWRESKKKKTATVNQWHASLSVSVDQRSRTERSENECKSTRKAPSLINHKFRSPRMHVVLGDK